MPLEIIGRSPVTSIGRFATAGALKEYPVTVANEGLVRDTLLKI